MFLFWVKKLYDILLVVLNQSVLDNISTNMKYYYIFKKHSGDDPYILECQPRRTERVPEKTQDISELWCITHSRCSPVWILTLCSLEVNWSLTVNTCPFSISLDLGSLVRIRCVGFPHAKDCNARTNSRSGISVSCWISCRKKKKIGFKSKTVTPICTKTHIYKDIKSYNGRVQPYKKCVPTSKVHFSLLLKSMRMVIWKVETCRMCLRVLDPVTWAPPIPNSEPSSCTWRRFKKHVLLLNRKIMKILNDTDFNFNTKAVLKCRIYLFNSSIESCV